MTCPECGSDQVYVHEGDANRYECAWNHWGNVWWLDKNGEVTRERHRSAVYDTNSSEHGGSVDV